MSWMNRLTRLVPVTGFVQELVKFDTQLMQNAAISGVEYQQGELAGYELKEYLLEKFDRKCVYCGKSGVVLNVEHIIPKARGGSNRVSNIAIACVQCNQKKGAMPIEDFLKKKPALLAQGSSSKTPVTKPDGTKMFRSVFLNDARRCCFFYQHNSKILL